MNKSQESLSNFGAILDQKPRTKPQLFGSNNIAMPDGCMSWKVGKVMNQATTSACTGFACVGMLMAEPIAKNVLMSVLFDYHNESASMSQSEMVAYDIYRKAQYKDAIPGAEPDYYGTQPESALQVTKNLFNLAGEIKYATSVEQIAKFLIQTGPVVMGTVWTASMTNANIFGKITARGESTEGHAYLISAVDTHAKQFRILNSWGKSWGLNGYAFIDFESMHHLINLGGYGLVLA